MIPPNPPTRLGHSALVCCSAPPLLIHSYASVLGIGYAMGKRPIGIFTDCHAVSQVQDVPKQEFKFKLAR